MAKPYLNIAQDVILKLGTPGYGDGVFNMFQFFQKANLAALELFSANTGACINKTILRNRFDEKVSNDQTVFVDVVQATNPGVGSASVRIGNIANGLGSDRVGLVQSPIIQEDFVLSAVQESLRSFQSKDPKERLEWAFAANIGNMAYNLMLRAEVLALTFIDTEKWIGGGNGTIYSPLGDYKEIPAGLDPRQWTNVTQETDENRITKGGNVQVLGSLGTRTDVTNTGGYSTDAQFNVASSLVPYDFYYSNQLLPPDPVTQANVFYTIQNGGVGMMGWGFDYTSQGEVFRSAQDSWTTTAPPALPAFSNIDLDLFEIEVKGYEGYQDTSGTFVGNDSAIIDIISSVSMVLKMNFFRAYIEAPGVARPVVGYVKKK